MDWVTFKDAVHAWFESATGLTCIWGRQIAPVPSSPFGLLSVVSDVEIGTGETAFAKDDAAPAGSDMIPTVAVHRQITVQCQVVVDEPPAGTVWNHNQRADHYLGLARLSLRSPGPLATLRAANVSHVRTEATMDLSDTRQGRWVDRAVMDVVFGAVGYLTDNGTSYIESTLISGGINGTQTDGAADFTDEEFGG